MVDQRDMLTSELQDTEITLGTGKLLGIFFSLVIVCGLFFGLGFNFGRATTPQSETTLQAIPPTLTVAGGTKPSPSHVAPAPPAECPLGQDCTQSASATPADPNAGAGTAPVSTASSPTGTATAPPELTQTSAATTTAATPVTFVVQVAAVTRKEDAEALMGALKQKSYPVFVVADPDKLFHVQVGPFVDKKDAQAMRDKLSGDGYNPILK
jgi:DedD protein